MKIRKQPSKEKRDAARPGALAASPLKTGVALVFWGVLLLFCWFNRDRISVESIVNYAPENTAAAVCIMLALFAFKGVTVVIYGGVLYAASGVLFPLPTALCVNLAGTVLMTSVPFFIGKRAGAGLLDQLARKNRKLELLRDAPRQNEFLFPFAVRAAGVLPCDLVGMYLGASGLRYSRYIAGTAAGMLPSILSLTVMGLSAHEVSSPAFLISAGCKVLLTLPSFSACLLWRKKTHKENTT